MLRTHYLFSATVEARDRVGSELREYHSPPIMMMMQLCILRAIENQRVPRLVF